MKHPRLRSLLGATLATGLINACLVLTLPTTAQAAGNADLTVASGAQQYQHYTDVTDGGQPWTLQRLENGTWVDVAQATSVGGELNLPIPVDPLTDTTEPQVTFRHTYPGGGGYGPATGQSFTVQYRNPSLYTGDLATLRGYVQALCPTTLIRLAPITENKEWTGEYNFGDNLITVSTKVNKKSWRNIMLHECAHHHQDLAYTNAAGELDFEALRDDMASAYRAEPAKGFEYNADCVAFQWGAAEGGYNGPCALSSELTAANDIANARRYGTGPVIPNAKPKKLGCLYADVHNRHSLWLQWCENQVEHSKLTGYQVRITGSGDAITYNQTTSNWQGNRLFKKLHVGKHTVKARAKNAEGYGPWRTYTVKVTK